MPLKAGYDALILLSGAPRSMKTGTTHSLFPYDAVSRRAIQSANLRWRAILRYASPALSAISGGGPVTFESGTLDQSQDRREVPER